MHGQIGMEDILFIPLFQQIFHKQKYLCGSCGIQKHRQRYLGAALPNPVSGTRQINLSMGCGTSEAGKTPQSFTNWTKTWRVLTCGDIQGWEKNCKGSNFLRGNPSISLKHKQKKQSFEHSRNTRKYQHQPAPKAALYRAELSGDSNECPATPVLQEAAAEAIFSAIGTP